MSCRLATSMVVLLTAFECVQANECLAARTDVVGRVLRADRRTPAARVGVLLVPSRASAIARRARATGSGARNVEEGPKPEKRTVTDEQGRFSLGSLEDPADWVVRAELSSSVFTEIDLGAPTHDADGDAREIVLPVFIDGHGRVAGWKPEWRSQMQLFYSGADVDIAGPINADGSFDLGALPSDAGLLYVSTGPRRTFGTCMGPVEDGPPRIDLGAPGLALVRTGREIELPTAPACLRVTVTLSGKPAQGPTVTARSVVTTGLTRYRSFEVVGTTNEVGVAELGDLPAGTWTAHVSDRKMWFVPLADPIELVPWRIVDRQIDIPRSSDP